MQLVWDALQEGGRRGGSARQFDMQRRCHAEVLAGIAALYILSLDVRSKTAFHVKIHFVSRLVWCSLVCIMQGGFGWDCGTVHFVIFGCQIKNSILGKHQSLRRYV